MIGLKSAIFINTPIYPLFTFQIWMGCYQIYEAKFNEFLTKHKCLLTLCFPMFPFDPPENIRKPKVF